MFNGHEWMWGMHWGWWIVWAVVIAAAIIALIRPNGRQEPPLELLKRRYANGEISAEEYEERKERLERDRIR